jgi:hypothetical protein
MSITEQTVPASRDAERRGAPFGRSTLWVLAAAIVIGAFLCLIPPSTLGCSEGMGYLFLVIFVPSALCMPNVGLAVVGLVGREHPRWPAVVGLALSIGPAILALYILSTIQWHR